MRLFELIVVLLVVFVVCALVAFALMAVAVAITDLIEQRRAQARADKFAHFQRRIS